jgi:DnaJ like chaperone protein
MGIKWVWIILAIAYVLSRIDLIPDVIAGWGWIDDIVVLWLLFRYLARIKRMKDLFDQGGPFQQTTQNRSSTEQSHDHSQSTVPKTPHEILGVPPSASREEIRTAYRQLANQYHPDKVAHLGKEFQELAEQRFREIQDAYDRLK